MSSGVGGSGLPAAPVNAAGTPVAVNAAGTPVAVNAGAVTLQTLTTMINNRSQSINDRLTNMNGVSKTLIVRANTLVDKINQLKTAIQTTGTPLKEDELENIMRQLTRTYGTLNAKLGTVESTTKTELERTVVALETALRDIEAAQANAVTLGAGGAFKASQNQNSARKIAKQGEIERVIREIEPTITSFMAMIVPGDKEISELTKGVRKIFEIQGFDMADFRSNVLGNQLVEGASAYLVNYYSNKQEVKKVNGTNLNKTSIQGLTRLVALRRKFVKPISNIQIQTIIDLLRTVQPPQAGGKRKGTRKQIRKQKRNTHRR